MKKALCIVLCVLIGFSPASVHAQGFALSLLPQPGAMVATSARFEPVLIKGLMISPNEPLKFRFIVDSGNDKDSADHLKKEGERMMRYFLAAVTLPEKDLWVNLSPYEHQRMITDELGNTDLGRDMLAQDYTLKQLTASSMDPQQGIGQEFWTRVYAQAQAKFGSTDIPVDTFNKVWIMPAEARVYQQGNAVYVTKATFKVMLDADYQAMQNNGTATSQETSPTIELAKEVLRQVIVPALEKEVNEGANFATIRQIYYAGILAKWYREAIKDTLMAQAYVDHKMVAGVDLSDKTVKEQIYQRYIEAFKKGVVNVIREEADATGTVTPKKYFSGGVLDIMPARLDNAAATEVASTGRVVTMDFAAAPDKADEARVRSVVEQFLPGPIEQGAPAGSVWEGAKGLEYTGTTREALIDKCVKQAAAFEALGVPWTVKVESTNDGKSSYVASLDYQRDESTTFISDANVIKKEDKAQAPKFSESDLKLLRDQEGTPGYINETTGFVSKRPFNLERVKAQLEQVTKDIEIWRNFSDTELRILAEMRKGTFNYSNALEDYGIPGGDALDIQLRYDEFLKKIDALVAQRLSQIDPTTGAISVSGKAIKTFKGEEVHILNSVGRSAEVVGRIDRNIAEAFGLPHETANTMVVVVNADGKEEEVLQIRNKDNYDDHLAVFGGHVGVGEDHLSAAKEELEQELGLPSLDHDPVFVDTEDYDRRADGDNNVERRSWFKYRLTAAEFEKVKARMSVIEAAVGVKPESVTREEYKNAFFRVQSGLIEARFFDNIPGAFDRLVTGGILVEVPVDKMKKVAGKPWMKGFATVKFYQLAKSFEEEETKAALSAVGLGEDVLNILRAFRSGGGEVVGVVTVNDDQLDKALVNPDHKESPYKDKTNRYLQLPVEFNGVKETKDFYFAPDSLDLLLTPKNTDLWNKIKSSDASMTGNDPVLEGMFTVLVSGLPLEMREQMGLAFREIRQTDPLRVEPLVARVAQLLKSEDKVIRNRAAIAAIVMKDKGLVSTLLSMVDDQDADVKNNVLMALRDIHDARVVPALVDGLGSDSDDVRHHSAMGLGAWPKLAPIEALRSLAERKGEPEDVHGAAVWAMQMAGARFEGELAAVDGEFAGETMIAAKLAEEPHDFVNEFVDEIVANTSGERGNYDLWRTRYLTITDRDDVNALVAPHIMNQNAAVSRWAITVLAMRGGVDAEAALLDAVSNAPTYWAKRTAVWGLGMINAGRKDKTDPRVIDVLKSNKGLHDPDFQTVAAAVVALGNIGGEQALGIVLKALETEEDPFVLSAMIDALLQIGDPRGVKAVEALKENANEMIRAKVAAVTGSRKADASMLSEELKASIGAYSAIINDAKASAEEKVLARKNLESTLKIVRDGIESIETQVNGGVIISAERVNAIDVVMEKIRAGEMKLKGESVDILKMNARAIEMLKKARTREEGQGIISVIKVNGTIDRNIAEQLGYFHQTANAFVLTPGKKVLVQVRAPWNTFGFFRSIYGGHLVTGMKHITGVTEELDQELNLQQKSKLFGKLSFVSFDVYDEPGSNNKEVRSLSVYQGSASEWKKIEKELAKLTMARAKAIAALKADNKLDADLKAMIVRFYKTPAAASDVPAEIMAIYKAGGERKKELVKVLDLLKDVFIKEMKAIKSGLGEVWDIEETTWEALSEQSRVKTYTPDLLGPIMADAAKPELKAKTLEAIKTIDTAKSDSSMSLNDASLSQQFSVLLHNDVSEDQLPGQNIDVLMIPGNDDLNVYRKVLELKARGIGKHILISGGTGRLTLDIQKTALANGFNVTMASEAEMIRSILIQMAEKNPDWQKLVPDLQSDDVMILEKKAAYTVQNFSLAKEELKKRGLLGGNRTEPLKLLYIQKPLQQLRTKGNFESVFASEMASGQIQGISFTTGYTPNDTAVQDIVGEYFRIIVNGQKGDWVVKEGYGIIPEAKWGEALGLFNSLNGKEKDALVAILRKNVENMKMTREDVLKGLPEQAAVFARAIVDYSQEVGGIDISSINLVAQAGSSAIKFDDEALRSAIGSSEFKGFTPVFLGITPVAGLEKIFPLP
ncbi:MAG: HEAT repeat domain-containing protein [Candidatus Omnitrophota bacterium]